jgi:excisionase family DNA binding protein
MSTNAEAADEVLQASDITARGFVRVPFAMAFLQMSRTGVYGLMDKGDLPYAKFGRSRRIPRVALEKFAKQQIVNR